MTLISAIACPDPKAMYALRFIFITDLAKPHTAQLGRAISRFMASFDMHAGQAGDARCRCLMPDARKSVGKIVCVVGVGFVLYHKMLISPES